jgi:hypothetical protein
MKKSDLNDYPEYFEKYVNLVEDEDLIDALENSTKKIKSFLYSIPEEKLEFRYQQDKWTIKEIISHLIDSERILSYRALRFARNDHTELHGYEQDDYVKNSKSNERKINDLINEYLIANKSTIELFKSFNEEMLLRKGIANKLEVSVLLIGFVATGHCLHHMNIINQRYLI